MYLINRVLTKALSAFLLCYKPQIRTFLEQANTNVQLTLQKQSAIDRNEQSSQFSNVIFALVLVLTIFKRLWTNVYLLCTTSSLLSQNNWCHLTYTLYNPDTSLRRSVWVGPDGVRLRESSLYFAFNFLINQSVIGNKTFYELNPAVLLTKCKIANCVVKSEERVKVIEISHERGRKELFNSTEQNTDDEFSFNETVICEQNLQQYRSYMIWTELTVEQVYLSRMRQKRSISKTNFLQKKYFCSELKTK